MTTKKDKPKATEMTRIKKRTHLLQCELSPGEIRESSELLADAVRKLKDAQARLKSIATAIKGEITKFEGTISQHAERVNSKTVYRDVECQVEFFFATKEKKWTRVDTNECFKTEPISPHEMQEAIPLEQSKQGELGEGDDN